MTLSNIELTVLEITLEQAIKRDELFALEFPIYSAKSKAIPARVDLLARIREEKQVRRM